MPKAKQSDTRRQVADREDVFNSVRRSLLIDPNAPNPILFFSGAARRVQMVGTPPAAPLKNKRSWGVSLL
jgi:hypothetical protein